MVENTKNLEKFIEETKVKPSFDRSEILKEELRKALHTRYLEVTSKNEKGFALYLFNKFKWLGFATSTFLIALFTIAITTPTLNNKKEDTKFGAEIAFLEGDLEVKKGEDWVIADIDTRVSEGSAFRMNGEGRAVINIDDGSSVRFMDDSSVTFLSLDPDDIVIQNDQGEVYTRVVKADRGFSVKVDTFTFKSLGTAYKTVNKKDKVGVEVYHSKVDVVNDGTEKQLVRVTEGNKFYVVDTAEPNNVNQVVELDKEVIAKDEFVQWNKSQDKKEFKNELGVLADEESTKEVDEKENSEKQNTDNVIVAENNNSGEKETTPIDKNNTSTTINSNKKSFTDYKGGVNKNIISLSWTLNNTGINQKVIVRQKDTQNLNQGEFFTIEKGKSNYEFQANYGETYYLTLCNYSEALGSCMEVSNTLAFVVPFKPSITLSVSETGYGEYIFNWETVNIINYQGLMLVRSDYEGDVYGSATSSSGLINKETKSYKLNSKEDKIIFFKLCKFDGSICDTYSNEVKITSPEPKVDSINISLDESGSTLNINIIGQAEDGLIFLTSSANGVVYPPRDNNDSFILLGTTNSIKVASLPLIKGSNKYFIRVCENINSAAPKCGVYSNEVVLNIKEEAVPAPTGE
ncbi:MAG: FecR domain-containing protein [Candidatus Dojkabacteria bacterium]|nr:FecR domain-containing protein [Candidatus Dojkabacteria bacterium]MDQ7020651.1 FecR domain-containing protein [Candidatus Dojkabacteria bacterium]